MAVEGNDTSGVGSGSGRRFAIGASVTIAIVAAAALLVAINWICSIKSYRRDIAALGNYGASDRTKRILSETDGEIKLSLLYTPDPENPHQQHYIERLLDYCEEIRRINPKVSVTHVSTLNQREALVTRISGTFGGEADRHRKALETFDGVRTQLETDLDQHTAAAEAILSQESWLSDFPLFAQVVLRLREIRTEMGEVAEAISEFAPEGGIPKYADATGKAKEAAGSIKKDLENISELMGQFNGLAEEATKPDSVYIALLRDVASQARDEVDSLRQTIGAEGAELPADIAAALKAYADRGVAVGAVLDNLVQRVNQFAETFPMVTQHANWSTQVQRGPLRIRYEVGSVLQDISRGLQQNRLGLLGVIDTGDPAQLQQALTNVRRTTSRLEQNAAVCGQLLVGLADRLASLDDASRLMIEAGRGGGLFKAQIDSLASIEQELTDLPELKLGSVADELKEDNSVVIELNGKIQVVGFESVWPPQERIPGARTSDEELPRTFNGDSVISSAILALSSDKPFGHVTLLAFEPPPPQQRNPFSRPAQSSIPLNMLSEVKKRLESANFKVSEWNLATQKEKPALEEGDEALEELYIALPPTPPTPPSPFGGPPPNETLFGEEHRQIVRDLLEKDARILFLANWQLTAGAFGGPPMAPPYGYEPLLEKDWGLRIDNGVRIIYVEPDIETGHGFSVVRQHVSHLPVTGFTDHPIGKPMRGTRFLITDACKIESVGDTPKGITRRDVLSIPSKETYIGADPEMLVEIVNAINDPDSQGRIDPRRQPEHGPFSLMVTCERKAGETSKGRIAVIAFGTSLTDRHLMQPVIAESKSIQLDPPPKENLDLFINAMYWLNGTEEYIGRGPVPIPRIGAIDGRELQWTRAFVWAIWPAMVFAPGIILWMIRRR
ncbi:MAG: hypothetical protein ACE5EQ_07445 [Phycisphaerae bacterium]